jgi:GxxExxY protein
MEQSRKGGSENEISKCVVELCLKIHRRYGPGLFESVYEEIFCYDLNKMGIPFQRQQDISLIHEELFIERSFRADVLIENKVIVELKSVDELAELHYKQVNTYLKLTGLKLGMLINFNVPLIKEGIHRIVNKL